MRPTPRFKSHELQPPLAGPATKPRKHLRDGTILEDHPPRAPKSGDENKVDLGLGLLTCILANKSDHGSDIWNSICSNQIDNPFGKVKVPSPKSLNSFGRAQILESTFPPLDDTLRLVDIGFSTCYRLHEIVDRQHLLNAVGKLYAITQDEELFPYIEYCALLAAVLALAHALDAKGHKVAGCDSAINRRYVSMHAFEYIINHV